MARAEWVGSFVVLLAVFALSACGSDDGGSDDSGGNDGDGSSYTIASGPLSGVVGSSTFSAAVSIGSRKKR